MYSPVPVSSTNSAFNVGMLSSATLDSTSNSSNLRLFGRVGRFLRDVLFGRVGRFLRDVLLTRDLRRPPLPDFLIGRDGRDLRGERDMVAGDSSNAKDFFYFAVQNRTRVGESDPSESWRPPSWNDRSGTGACARPRSPCHAPRFPKIVTNSLHSTTPPPPSTPPTPPTTRRRRSECLY